jgi:hypothetical protein
MNEIDILKQAAPEVSIRGSVRADAQKRLQSRIAGIGSGAPRRRLRYALGAVALLTAGMLVGPALVRPDTPQLRAGALVLPDGTRLTRTDISGYVFSNRLDELQARLAEHGVGLQIDYAAVHPDADGRLYGWSFYPGPNSGHGWDIDSSDSGGTVTIEIGRGEKSLADTHRGLDIFEAFPEVCDAIHSGNLQRTHRELMALGFRVQWTTLPGHPDDSDYTGASSEVRWSPPREGAMYAIGGERLSTPATRYVWIEVVPEGSGPGFVSGSEPSACLESGSN